MLSPMIAITPPRGTTLHELGQNLHQAFTAIMILTSIAGILSIAAWVACFALFFKRRYSSASFVSAVLVLLHGSLVAASWRDLPKLEAWPLIFLAGLAIGSAVLVLALPMPEQEPLPQGRALRVAVAFGIGYFLFLTIATAI